MMPWNAGERDRFPSSGAWLNPSSGAWLNEILHGLLPCKRWCEVLPKEKHHTDRLSVKTSGSK